MPVLFDSNDCNRRFGLYCSVVTHGWLNSRVLILFRASKYAHNARQNQPSLRQQLKYNIVKGKRAPLRVHKPDLQKKN